MSLALVPGAAAPWRGSLARRRRGRRGGGRGCEIADVRRRQRGAERERALAALRACHRLRSVSTTDLEQAAEGCLVSGLAAGDAVFRWGETGQAMFVVETGRIASRLRSAEGQLIDVGFAGPGDLFGYFEVFGTGRRDCDAVALEPSTVVVVPPPWGLRLLAASTATLLDVVDDLLAIVREQNLATGARQFATVEARLAILLLDLADAGGRVRLEGPQTLLAHQLGAARQSVNRSLGRLAEAGVLRVEPGGRSIQVVDRRALEERAGRHPLAH